MLLKGNVLGCHRPPVERGAYAKYALHLDKVRGRGCAHAKITTLALWGNEVSRCGAVRGEF